MNFTKSNWWKPGIDYPAFMLERSLETLRGGYLIGEETPRDAIRRIAKRVDELIPKNVYKGNLEEAVFNHIWEGSICPSTPVWSNFGTERGLPISCFGSYISDSITGIYGTLAENAKMSQLGGGTSSYWGDVRPRGSRIASQDGSTGGVFEFLGNYDSMIQKVSQGGTRRGSHAVYVPFSHGDIDEVLNIKKVGSSIQDLFYGVTITREDYDKIYSGDSIALDKWARILESRSQTGIPYILNSTNANEGSSTPPWYGKSYSKILASNLCFTGDTMVAMADGTNAKSIKDLAEMSEGKIKFPVYSGKERGQMLRGRRSGGTVRNSSWKPEIKMAVAFKTGTKEVIKVTLSNGDSFKCTSNHELALNSGGYIEASESLGKELAGFFSYTPLEKSAPYRHINSLTSGNRKQHLMIYDKFGSIPNLGNIDHLDNNILYPDVISNLQTLSVSDHRIKTSSSIEGENNWMFRVKDKSAYSKNRSRSDSGKGNSNFSGISNFELIEIGREVKAIYGEINYSNYLKHKDSTGLKLPLTFSNYRFGKSFDKYISYVNGDLNYEGELDEKSEYTNHASEFGDKQSDRLKYLKSTFYEDKDSCLSTKGLVVTSIEDAGVEDVYDLTVEDNHNFYIITSTEDETYRNCQGVLVHNCSEIMLPSNEYESFVCCLMSMNALYYDTWKDNDAVEVAMLIMEAILEDFITKTTGVEEMQKARRFAQRHHAVGLGILGYADYLQSKMQPYIGWFSTGATRRIYGTMKVKAESMSETMAKLMGNAPFINEYNLREGENVLRRHTTLLAQAPTTSNATIQGVFAGMDAQPSNYYVQKSAKGNFTVANPFLTKLIKENYPEHDTPDMWGSIRDSSGSIMHLNFMTEEEKEVFLTFSEINQFEIVRLAGVRQEYLDQGQSLNVHISPDTDPAHISALYLMGEQLGIKAFYYQRSSNILRDKNKTNVLTMDAEACVSCAG